MLVHFLFRFGRNEMLSSFVFDTIFSLENRFSLFKTIAAFDFREDFF